MKLSVIIISFRSNHLLNRLLKIFPKNFEIIVIENSLNHKTKTNLEKKFQNTKVIIPSKNLGYASAFNLAYKKSKNNFIITITPDVIFEAKLIKNLQIIINSFKNFSLLAPAYKNQKTYRNYVPKYEINNKYKKIKNTRIEEVKDIDWCFCLINKKKFKGTKLLDENYFLYFETMDLCKNLYTKRHKMYVLKDLKFKHIGTSSTQKKYNLEIQINRNWHFSWSKFYYFKKNSGYFYALKKVLPNIYQSLIGITISIIKLNLSHIKLHYYSLMGIMNGIILNKSYYRPTIKE